jgi:hypothetical protein
MSYWIVDSFRAGSGWSILILLEICLHFQNKFEKLVLLFGFIIRKFFTMRVNVKLVKKWYYIVFKKVKES